MVLTVRGFAACKFFSVIVVKIQLDLRCSLFQFRKLNEDVIWTVNLLNFSGTCGFVWIHRERKIAGKTVIAQSKYVTIQNYFTKIHVFDREKEIKNINEHGFTVFTFDYQPFCKCEAVLPDRSKSSTWSSRYPHSVFPRARRNGGLFISQVLGNIPRYYSQILQQTPWPDTQW